MLSPTEIEKIKWQLNNIPSSFDNQQSTNFCRTLRKKLKEHQYSTTYEHFEPLPHMPYFINRTTNETTLRSIIGTASSTNEFTMDTESVKVRGQRNIPTLIQLQIILPKRPSLIMIIEMHHLPREDHPEFSLIKELFRIVLLPEKTSYIFGSKDELVPFTRFGLFTTEQIKLMKFIDLQKNFKRFWNEQHQHQQINSTNDKSINNCICEHCIGKKSSDSWSLQDCVGYQLNQYLPKIYSESNFDIGLDPNLYRRTSMELEHRNKLSAYAFNDCLSMEMIIAQMKMKKFKFYFDEQIRNRRNLMELSPISSDDDDDIFDYTRIKTNQTFPIITGNNNQKRILNEHEEILLKNKKQKNSNDSTTNNESKLIENKLFFISSTPSIEKNSVPKSNIKINSKNDNWNTNSSNTNSSSNISTIEHRFIRQTTNQLHINRTKLSEAERKKIHNRTCTIKQRQRCYQHEIIRRDIDNRFSYTTIKQILKKLNIPYNIVNKSTSSTSNQTTLFIGIKDPEHMNIYERATRNLFSTDHYHEFIHAQRRN